MFCLSKQPISSLSAGGIAIAIVPAGIQLAQAMRSMQGKMMLSINDHPDIRALFAEFKVVELELAYSVGRQAESRGKRGELVVMNY